MAQPRVLGRVDLSAATPVNIFASPTAGASFTVRIVNDNAVEVFLKLCLSDTTGTIQTKGQLIPDSFALDANTALVVSGLTIESGFFCVVESSSASVNANAYAWEAA